MSQNVQQSFKELQTRDKKDTDLIKKSQSLIEQIKLNNVKNRKVLNEIHVPNLSEAQVQDLSDSHFKKLEPAVTLLI